MQEKFVNSLAIRKFSINYRSKSRSDRQGLATKQKEEEASSSTSSRNNDKSLLQVNNTSRIPKPARIPRTMSCRGSTTLQQQKTLHSGWLLKTGGWQKALRRRWFEIKGDQLYYFKTKGDSKPLSAVLLAGNQVERKTGDAIHPFQFEIVSGEQREGRPVTETRESFVFMASSQPDLEDWITAINIVIYTPMGGGMFGRSLEDTIRVDSRRGGGMVPILVEKCVECIRHSERLEEGVFRHSGNYQEVEDLKDRFNKGEIPNLELESSSRIHNVASLLKKYFKMLPEPVIPFAFYEHVAAVAKLLKSDPQAGQGKLIDLLHKIPRGNVNTLKYISRFLHEFKAHDAITKMSLENLALVFGPNFLSPQSENPQMLMESSNMIAQMMEYFIKHHSILFPVTEDERFFTPKSPNGTPSKHAALPSPIGGPSLIDFGGSSQHGHRKSATFPRFPRSASADAILNPPESLPNGKIEASIEEQDLEAQVDELASELELQRSQFEVQVGELEKKLDAQKKVVEMLKIRLHEEHKARTAAELRLELYRVGIEEYCQKFGGEDIGIHLKDE